MGNKMEPCYKKIEETEKKGIERTNHGREASPREFYPMKPIQRGTCLRAHVSFQGHCSNGETPRGKFKEGNSKGVRKREQIHDK
ncbi:hypothetical protein TNCT_88751 [Trichonephila clavata]|uniref:Uncharacterized protein n=1 Tax=Trichonephila clavata TaxID=2740835 RepID=A0A8X6GE96_TRICU|nr:hypothetical protein TNCT_88751 [Trichonephila clavata]